MTSLGAFKSTSKLFSSRTGTTAARALGGFVFLLLNVLTAQGAAAQAICSAPHSSPTLAQSGEVRTLVPGEGWIQLSFAAQWATEFYNSLGERQPFLAESEFTTRSLFLTGSLGLLNGLEVWAQVPTHNLNIDASSGTSNSRGVGDVRVAARVSPELVGLDIPLAVRVGAKVPGSDFPVDATVLPLTEGQTDIEVSLESGSLIGDLPLYVAGWVGYRWRGSNTKAARTPGAERFAHVAVGGFVGQLTWEVGADGLWGDAPLAQGIELPSEKRRMVLLQPTLGYQVGPGRLEVTGLLPLDGRVLPAASGVSAGYRLVFGQ
jgi:hypothetical protein